jgi:hypothetical protein
VRATGGGDSCERRSALDLNRFRRGVYAVAVVGMEVEREERRERSAWSGVEGVGGSVLCLQQ